MTGWAYMWMTGMQWCFKRFTAFGRRLYLETRMLLEAALRSFAPIWCMTRQKLQHGFSHSVMRAYSMLGCQGIPSLQTSVFGVRQSNFSMTERRQKITLEAYGPACG